MTIDAVEGWRFVSVTDTDTSPGLSIEDVDSYRTALAAPIIRSRRTPKRVTPDDNVKLTVTVRAAPGLVPTSRVELDRPHIAIGTRQLKHGRASFNLPRLGVGLRHFTIRYYGDDRIKPGVKHIAFRVFRR